MNSDKTIDAITKIRARNNKLWMALLKLAFRSEPKKARQIMAKITAYDRQITKLMWRL